MTDQPIEWAVRVVEGLEAWVSLEDAYRLIQDRSLYGNSYIEPILDRDSDSLITHRRIPPNSVAHD